MNIEIIADDRHLSAADEKYIRSRLNLALAARRPAIDTVEVWVCDLAKFESPVIKHCRIDIELANGRTLIAASCDTNFEVVVERAATRAGRNLAGVRGWQTQFPGPVPARGSSNFGSPLTGYVENSA